MAIISNLFRSLSLRLRPEDVAEMIRQVLDGSLSLDESRTLDLAASGALTRQSWGYSSMATEFARPVGLANQVHTARELFPTILAPNDTECDNPLEVTAYIAAASEVIAKNPQKNDFKADRLNRQSRSAIGLGEISKRQYNKRFRLLQRMERKIVTLEREIRKREYTLVSKSRLANWISEVDFCADRDSACFIAYITARANLRSLFTNGPQTRAYDEVAEMLLDRCRRSGTANWWSIAYVHPTSEVLERLSQEQLGRLLAMWLEMLNGIAGLLKEVWQKSRFDRSTMIVRRGDDSTTWNATAGAWNKARDSWIELLHASGLETILDYFCPGKVLRLMAADVAAWHRRSGGGLEPDTKVWAELPSPWDVLAGSASCARTDVESACHRHGIDPSKKGWTQPRPKSRVEAFHPTPELVHGVEVGHPGLAMILRKLGVFSGKQVK